MDFVQLSLFSPTLFGLACRCFFVFIEPCIGGMKVQVIEIQFGIEYLVVNHWRWMAPPFFAVSCEHI